ncbi:uncharacterized protein LOC142498016 [Ascaphus truei]|uniref:uncharacterized protein LOC142498016 n=1 Tax=Ascaphus truei TaxID=8439 RepID=UPI003F59805E
MVPDAETFTGDDRHQLLDILEMKFLSPDEVSVDGASGYWTVPKLDPIAPGGHVSPEREQVSSPGSCSSTHLEEHDDEDDDDDATAIDTEIQSSEHEEVPIETVLPPNRPSTTTYDAIVASEGKIVEAENRRHSDLMTVLERMIALQEETISQLAHLHRVFIEVPKQLQKINTSFEALVVQQTQANYLRMTTVPHLNFNTSQAGSLHAGVRYSHGTRFAPSYANLFMGNGEEDYIWNNCPIGANLVLCLLVPDLAWLRTLFGS